METLARVIAGSAILFVGAMFTLFGALREFDGPTGGLVGMSGVAIVAFGLFALARELGFLQKK